MASKSADTAKLIRRSTLAAVGVAVLLVISKLTAWRLTGSLSVLASLVDSLLDAAASLINYMAIRYSLKRADADHPFGHGKAEYLAGLGQALFISASAIFIVSRAIDRLIHPQPLTSTSIGIVVMIMAMLITGGLVAYQQYVIRRVDCTALKADSLHYTTDLLTNAGTLAALLLARSGWPGFDPFIAMAIALVVIHSAWQIARESLHMLMDCQLSTGTREQLTSLTLAHPEVLGVHDIRARKSGQTIIIQLHLELAGDTSLNEAHLITKEVESSIREIIPTADVIIHQDPVTPPGPPGSIPPK